MASRADPKMLVDDRSIDHADIDTVSSPGFTVALARQLVADDRDRVLKQTCKLDQLVRQLSAGEVSHLRGNKRALRFFALRVAQQRAAAPIRQKTESQSFTL